MYKVSKFASLIVCLFLLIGLMVSCGGSQEAPQTGDQEVELAENEVELAENQETEQGAEEEGRRRPSSPW